MNAVKASGAKEYVKKLTERVTEGWAEAKKSAGGVWKGDSTKKDFSKFGNLLEISPLDDLVANLAAS
jgi:hypothetical protein